MKAKSSFLYRAVAHFGGACVALAVLTLAPAAHAGSNVYWSIGVASPGVTVGASNAYPVYSTPAPVYAAPPAPVYYAPPPAPVYYAPPRPVYVQPQPVYAPPPVYYNAPVVAAPPLPAYPVGWAPRGPFRHHHHHRRWGSDWRY